MGRLVGLELHNFKSYRGTTHVGFGSSYFTSIIGPNGSGKSNMMDAISFVLGVRSNQLRSKNIKSLIYRGRKDDNDDDDDDDDNDNDNDDDPDRAYVIAIYETDDKKILNLKRSIHSNGSASSFQINNTNVSVDQYLQVLKNENILIKAKNFLVFQGDVEKVASQSPQDLTKMIENISGSINLKSDFDSLKHERDKSHDLSTLKNSQKRSLKDEIKNLKFKVFEIDQFNKKIKSLDNLIISKYLLKLNHCQSLSDKLKQDLERQNSTLSTTTLALDSKLIQYKEFIDKQSDDNMSIKQYESKIEIDQSTLKSFKSSLIPLDSEYNQLKKKIKGYDDRIKLLNLEIKEQQSVVEDSTLILSKIQDAYTLFSNERVDANEKINTNHNISPQLLNEYNNLRNEFLSIAGTIELSLNKLNDEKSALLNEIEILKSNETLSNLRINDLSAKKSSIELKKSNLEKSIQSNKSSIKNYEKELNSLESLRNSIKEQEITLNDELKKVLTKLNEINSIQRENKRDKALRETVSTLKRIFPNVRGLLTDFIKPKQKKYKIAISSILSNDLNSIVVDSIQTATECINYMKEQRLGIASFIPLNSIKVKSHDSILRNLPNATPLFDTLTYPIEFEPLIHYLSGNSLVCDTMDMAISLRWNDQINVKIVTLDGSLIHKNGLMTGGNLENLASKWDKLEVSMLNDRKDELKFKINEIHSNLPDDVKDRVLNDEISKLELINLEHDKKLIDILRNLNDINVELDHELNARDDILNKLKEFDALVVELDTKINNETKEIEKYQSKIYTSFCSKYKFKSIQDYENNHNSRLIKQTRENSKYVKEISKLENKNNFEIERLNDYLKNLENLQFDRQKFVDSLSKISNDRQQLGDKIDDLQSIIDVNKEDYNKLLESLKSIFSRSNSMESEINNLKSSIKAIKKDILNIEEQIDSLNLEVRNQLVNLKLENVKLPLLSGSLDHLPLEDGSLEQDELNRQWDDVLSDLEINYSKLDDEYQLNDYQDDDDEQEFETLQNKIKTKIEKLRDEISNLNPDIHSREHLESAQEKYKEIELEFLNAKNKERENINKFEKIKDQRYEKFMNAFNHISKNIDNVYKELTKSKASPLGGSAYLTLEDEDEPYSFGIKYHIMPPLKRFRDMENLSGGEKTIGALALLFAIHSFHPSPFFVLDEIDAALDNLNVNKIANYIENNKGPNFQFIVISLKNILFERSDSLVGIYRDQEINSSKILTVDLRDCDDA